jgi:hypothetical protein
MNLMRLKKTNSFYSIRISTITLRCDASCNLAPNKLSDKLQVFWRDPNELKPHSRFMVWSAADRVAVQHYCLGRHKRVVQIELKGEPRIHGSNRCLQLLLHLLFQ